MLVVQSVCQQIISSKTCVNDEAEIFDVVLLRLNELDYDITKYKQT